MVCSNCKTVIVDWQNTCPECGVPTDRQGVGSRAFRLFRRWSRAALIAAAGVILVVAAYGATSKHLPLSFWTVPLILEVRDRIRDHPGALGALGDDIRLGWMVTGTAAADETGWRELRISVPVSGPTNEGTLDVRAGRGPRGPWTYTTLTLETAGGQRIDLLQVPRADIGAPPGGRRLYLVPLGHLRRISIDEIARHYRSRLGLQIDVLPAVDVPASLLDHSRRQLIAESAVETLRWRVGDQAANPSAIFIAITEHDMYIRNRDWRFTFSYRGDERFAVVSAARMAPPAYPYRGQEYRLYSRVRKMVGKNIGLLVYRFPLSTDPTSLLRDKIRSVADLDEMRDSFEGQGARAGTSDVPVSHRQPPVEPQITSRAAPREPSAGYPCFVMRPGVPLPSTHTARSATIATCSAGMRIDREYDELEVDLRTGMLVTRKTDLFVSDVLPLALTRSYRLWDQYPRAFGMGTNHPYDTFPVGSRQPYTYIDVVTGDGSKIHYDRISKGTGYADAVYEHVETASPFLRSRIQWNGQGWDLRLADGSVFVFPESYAARRSAEAALIGIRDAAQRAVRFDRDRRRNLRKLTAPTGGYITFDYDAGDRIKVAADHQGRTARFDYDPGGRLVAVTDGAGRTLRYHYDGGNLVAIDDGDSTSAIEVRYLRGRISELRLPNERSYRFRFDFEDRSKRNATTAFVTDPEGKTTEVDIPSGAVQRPAAKK